MTGIPFPSWNFDYGDTIDETRLDQLRDNINALAGLGGVNNAIPANALQTNAITLGTASITGNVATTNTSATLVTGLSVTVTIPAGGRNIDVAAFISRLANSNDGNSSLATIWDGTVGSGTQLQRAITVASGANSGESLYISSVVTPSAGSKTYNIGQQAGTGGTTSTVEAAATYPARIIVKAI